jgi:hypothetical protein
MMRLLVSAGSIQAAENPPPDCSELVLDRDAVRQRDERVDKEKSSGSLHAQPRVSYPDINDEGIKKCFPRAVTDQIA